MLVVVLKPLSGILVGSYEIVKRVIYWKYDYQKINE